jgi:hypothetical protein
MSESTKKLVLVVVRILKFAAAQLEAIAKEP